MNQGLRFKFNRGQFSGLVTEQPTVSILESSGLPTALPTKLPTISVYGKSGQPNLHGNTPMGIPLRCQLSCPLFQYMEVVGCLICVAIPMGSPWTAHSTSHWAAHFFIFRNCMLPNDLPMDSPLHCPLSYPRFHIWKSVGSLICMAKFPWAAPTPLPTCSQLAAKWAVSLYISYGSRCAPIYFGWMSCLRNLYGTSKPARNASKETKCKIKKFLLTLGPEPTSLRSEVWCSTNQDFTFLLFKLTCALFGQGSLTIIQLSECGHIVNKVRFKIVDTS